MIVLLNVVNSRKTPKDYTAVVPAVFSFLIRCDPEYDELASRLKAINGKGVYDITGNSNGRELRFLPDRPLETFNLVWFFERCCEGKWGDVTENLQHAFGLTKVVGPVEDFPLHVLKLITSVSTVIVDMPY